MNFSLLSDDDDDGDGDGSRYPSSSSSSSQQTTDDLQEQKNDREGDDVAENDRSNAMTDDNDNDDGRHTAASPNMGRRKMNDISAFQGLLGDGSLNRLAKEIRSVQRKNRTVTSSAEDGNEDGEDDETPLQPPDIISALIALHGNKERFLKEYRRLLSLKSVLGRVQDDHPWMYFPLLSPLCSFVSAKPKTKNQKRTMNC